MYFIVEQLNYGTVCLLQLLSQTLLVHLKKLLLNILIHRLLCIMTFYILTFAF